MAARSPIGVAVLLVGIAVLQVFGNSTATAALFVCPADCAQCGADAWDGGMSSAATRIAAMLTWLELNMNATTALEAAAPRAYFRVAAGSAPCASAAASLEALEGIRASALGPALAIGAIVSVPDAVPQRVLTWLQSGRTSGIGGHEIHARGDDWAYSGANPPLTFPSKGTAGYAFSLLSQRETYDGVTFPVGPPTLRATLETAWGALLYGLAVLDANFQRALGVAAAAIATANATAAGTAVPPETAVPTATAADTFKRVITTESAALLCGIAYGVQPSWAPELFDGTIAAARQSCEQLAAAMCSSLQLTGTVPRTLAWVDGAVHTADATYDVHANLYAAGLMNAVLAAECSITLPASMLLRQVMARAGTNRTDAQDPLSARYVARAPGGDADAATSLLALAAAEQYAGSGDDVVRNVSASLKDAAVLRACLGGEAGAASRSLNELSVPDVAGCDDVPAVGYWGSTEATALAVLQLAGVQYFALPASPPQTATTTPSSTTEAPTTTTATPTATTAAPFTTTTLVSSTPPPAPPTTTGNSTATPTTTSSSTSPVPTAPHAGSTTAAPGQHHDDDDDGGSHPVVFGIVGGGAALLAVIVIGLGIRTCRRRTPTRESVRLLPEDGAQPDPIGFF